MVSIIVPIYNVEKYLARCLDSLLNQSYKNLEIILMDDCGQDRSMDIAREYADKDERIFIFTSEINRGPMKAREKGYLCAKGDYLMFVDSDDTIPDDTIEVLLQKAKETDADIVAGQLRYLYLDGTTKIWRSSLPYGSDPLNVYKALLDGHFKHNLVAKLYKRSLFTDYLYPAYDNMTNAEDACLFYSLVRNTSLIETVDAVVYDYYQNPGSSTQKRLSLQQLDSIAKANKVRLECCSAYPEINRLLQHFVTSVLFNFYCYGYSSNEIKKILENNGLSQYGEFGNAMQYLSVKDFLRFTKSYLKSRVNL